MRLADFIDSSMENILAAWEASAATPLAFRAHMPRILQAIAGELRRLQPEAGQIAKAGSPTAAEEPQTAAEMHGTLRARDGFSMTQLFSEYRALRASVLQLWAKANASSNAAMEAAELMRFNEALDQAIAESVDFFSREFYQDQMARKEVDRQLELFRGRLEYASRLSNVGFWYCDLPFDVLEWDAQVKEHFFIDPASTVTIGDFYDRIYPEDREPTRLAIATSIECKSAYDIVYRTMHPVTGEVKWIRALGGTDYASDGSPIHFDGITVDVTAQKLEQKRVAESEARHRGVLTHMDEAFVLFDADFTIVEANNAACRLIGSSREELIGCNHWDRFPGVYESELGYMYRQVLADGLSKTVEHHYTFEDGRQYWFDARIFKVDSGVAVLFRDVTERREMIDALKSTDKRKDEFLAMLAHELRNPLAPITTAGEILARMPDPPKHVAAATAVIRRQSRHMTRLIDDLLDVARVTQGRIHLQRETVDIADVVMQSYETCEPQLRAKQQRLTMSIEKTAPLYVSGDSPRLVQCLVNVLSNAIKYTDPHGEIEVRVRGEEAAVVIDVSDSGIGIAPEFLPAIFDLFTQSHRALDRSQGGLGVGLAVLKRLIEMHGGQVSAHSEGEGRGSTFEIRLPRIAAPSARPEQVKSVTRTPRRISLVDDNVDAAQSLGVLLEMQGHTLLVVHSAHDALAGFAPFKPDVMLIDIGLPEIDGYTLIQQLRKQAALEKTKMIALTGYGQSEDKQRAFDAGFDEHLVKPVDIEVLERTIASLFQAGSPTGGAARRRAG